ncbi:hypothetical protein GE061_019529 [Apolygus lucorum]|uniref:Uncharacterized protein n=1 Tax=Apolygus lucorum TaxID=248454 RepID=A0A8S9XAN5_APOLU|nr:hypothetical protein GE061_019529 [Apolygus lucorum]
MSSAQGLPNSMQQVSHGDLGNPSKESTNADEAEVQVVPDGSGCIKYSAPEPDKLTLDPSIGYRFDPRTGLHFDANSGYFFNSKRRIFLYWDFLTQTYLKVQNPTLPFPKLKNQKQSSDEKDSGNVNDQIVLDGEDMEVSSRSRKRSRSRDRARSGRKRKTTRSPCNKKQERSSKKKSRSSKNLDQSSPDYLDRRPKDSRSPSPKRHSTRSPDNNKRQSKSGTSSGPPVREERSMSISSDSGGSRPPSPKPVFNDDHKFDFCYKCRLSGHSMESCTLAGKLCYGCKKVTTHDGVDCPLNKIRSQIRLKKLLIREKRIKAQLKELDKSERIDQLPMLEKIHVGDETVKMGDVKVTPELVGSNEAKHDAVPEGSIICSHNLILQENNCRQSPPQGAPSQPTLFQGEPFQPQYPQGVFYQAQEWSYPPPNPKGDLHQPPFQQTWSNAPPLSQGVLCPPPVIQGGSYQSPFPQGEPHQPPLPQVANPSPVPPRESHQPPLQQEWANPPPFLRGESHQPPLPQVAKPPPFLQGESYQPPLPQMTNPPPFLRGESHEPPLPQVANPPPFLQGESYQPPLPQMTNPPPFLRGESHEPPLPQVANPPPFLQGESYQPPLPQMTNPPPFLRGESHEPPLPQVAKPPPFLRGESYQPPLPQMTNPPPFLRGESHEPPLPQVAKPPPFLQGESYQPPLAQMTNPPPFLRGESHDPPLPQVAKPPPFLRGESYQPQVANPPPFPQGKSHQPPLQQEVANPPPQSTSGPVCHKCGMRGHTTIVCTISALFLESHFSVSSQSAWSNAPHDLGPSRLPTGGGRVSDAVEDSSSLPLKHLTRHPKGDQKVTKDDPQLAMQSFINALKHPDSFKNQMKTGSRDHNVQMTNLSSSVPHQSFATSGISSTTPLIDKTVTDRPIAHSVYQPTTDNRGMQSQIAGNITHTVAQNPTTFGVPNVPTIPMFTPNLAHLSVQQNIAMGFPSSVAGVQGQNLIQRLYLGLLGNLMSNNMRLPGLMMNSGVGLGNNVMNPAQGFVPNTNLGIPGNTAPQTPVMNLTGSTTSPSMNVPDGTGSFKYPAPDTKSLTFDPTIGYRFDPKTGLHYDANSGYFFNSKQKLFLYWDFLSQSYLKVENPTIPFPTLRNEKNVSKVDESSESSGSEDSDEGGRDVSSISRSKSRDRGLLKRQPMTTKQDIPGSSRRYSRSRSRDDDRRSSGSRKRTTNRSRSVDKRKRHRGRSSRSRTPPTRTSESSKNIKRDDSPIAKKSHKRDRRSNSRSPKRRSPRSSNRSKRGDDRRRKRSPDLSRSPSRSSNRKNSRRSRSRDNYRGRLVIRSPLRQNVGHSHKKRSLSPPQEVPSMPPMSKWELEEGTMRYGKASRWQQSPVVSRYSGKRHFSAVEDGGKSSGNNSKRRNQDQNEDLPSDSESVEEMTEELLESLLNGDDGDMNEESEEILPAEKNPCGRVQGDNHPLSDLYKSAPSRIVHLKPSVNGFVWKKLELKIGLAIIEMASVQEATNFIHRASLPYNVLRYIEVEEEKQKDANLSIYEETPSSYAWMNNRVPGDSDPVSDLYSHTPSCSVHVKPSEGNMIPHVVKKSLEEHLIRNNVNYVLKVSVNNTGMYGSPVDYIQVWCDSESQAESWFLKTKRKITLEHRNGIAADYFLYYAVQFESESIAEEWFLKTNRKIALQHTDEMEADYFLYYADKPWECEFCLEKNIFFRSLCHNCFQDKDYFVNSVRYSITPTQYLGLCKLPPSTSIDNVVSCLPVSGPIVGLKRIRVVEDPNMKCCSGLVILEMSSVEDATKFRQQASLPYRALRYIVDNCGINQEPSLTIEEKFSAAGVKESVNRVQGDLDPFSCFYRSDPSCIVHVKPSMQGFDGSVVKESLQQHLLTNDIKSGKILIVHQNNQGSPFGFIEVRFDSIAQAEKWFLRTNRKITIQHTKAIKAEYFLYYADEPWDCGNCHRARNIFFRVMCYSCSSHKNDPSHSVKFSSEPSKFLGICKMPFSTNEINVMQRLPEIVQDSVLSIRVIDDPGMHVCSGLVVVEVPNVDVAVNIVTSYKSPRVLLRYVDEDVYLGQQKIVSDAAEISEGILDSEKPSSEGNSGDQLVDLVQENTDSYSHLYKSGPSCFVHVKTALERIGIPFHEIKQSLQEYFIQKGMFTQKITPITKDIKGSPFDCIQVLFDSEITAKNWFLETNRKISLQHKLKKMDYFLYYAYQQWYCEFCLKLNFCLRSLCYNCFQHKNNSVKTVRFCTAPTKFLGFCKLPPSTNKGNVVSYLPTVLQNVDLNRIEIVVDTNMECCSGLVIIEMSSVEEAVQVRQQLSLPYRALRYVAESYIGIAENTSPDIEKQVGTAYNPVQNDPDPFSHLYRSDPSRIVHVKAPIKGFKSSMVKKSLQEHLFTNNIKSERILIDQSYNSVGSPFVVIEVRFESIVQVEKWFLLTNRKITLSVDDAMKAEFTLYFADVSWVCGHCPDKKNVFFRATCHHCYRHRSDSSHSFKLSDEPTRFLGVCKMPPSTNDSNVMERLPEAVQDSALCIRVVEDPGMQACGGLVVVELPNVDVAKNIMKSTRRKCSYVDINRQQVMPDGGDTSIDLSLKNHDLSYTLSPKAAPTSSTMEVPIKPSQKAIHSNTSGVIGTQGISYLISKIYTNGPSNIVHVKLTDNELTKATRKATAQLLPQLYELLQQHLQAKEIDFTSIDLRMNELGSPLNFIEVSFKSVDEAKEWFTETSGAVTLSLNEGIEIELQLCYAKNYWYCEFCLAANAFFRSLCHNCYQHKSNDLYSVKFSITPTRHLGFCNIPCWTNSINALTRLPKIMRDSYKIIRVVEDPEMLCCCGLIIVEMPTLEEALTIVEKTGLSYTSLRYVAECDTVSQEFPSRVCMKDPFVGWGYLWHCNHCSKRNVSSRSLCSFCYRHRRDEITPVCFSGVPTKFLGFCQLPRLINESNVLLLLPQNIQRYHFESIRVVDDPTFGGCCGIVIFEMLNVEHAAAYYWLRCPVRYVDMANSDETYHRLLYTRQAPDDLQENMEIGSDEFPISRCVSSAESEENISIVTEKCDIPEVPPSHCSESSLVAGEAQESKESNTLMELVDCTEDPTLPEDVAPAAISCSTEQISSGIDRAETEGNTSIVTKCVVPDDHHCSESPLGIGEALESKESNTLMELVDCNEDPTLPEDVAPAAISCSTEQISSGIDIAETEGNTSIVTKCLVPDDHHCSESPLGSGEALESKDPNTLIELEDFENPTVPEDVAPAAMSCSIEQISSRIDRAETEGNASIVTKCVVPDDHHCSESSPNFDVDQELDESILLVEGGDSKVVATITECVALSESGSNSIQISSEITCAVNEENVSFEKTKIENLIVDTSRYSESSTNEEDQESDKSKMFVKPGDSKIGTNPEIVAAVNIDSNEEMNCTGNQENPSKFIPDVYPSHCSESFSTAEGVEASKQSEIAVEVGDSTISEDVASVGVNCGDVQIFGGNEETKSEIPDVLPSQRSETPPNNMEAQESKESRMIMEDDDCAENLSVSEDVVNIGCSDKDS